MESSKQDNNLNVWWMYMALFFLGVLFGIYLKSRGLF